MAAADSKGASQRMKTRSQQETIEVARVVDDAVLTAIQTEFSTFINSIDFKNKLKEVLTVAMAETIEAALTPLKNRIFELETQLREVQEKCNDNEQYSRRYSVRIYGVEFVADVNDDGEDCVKTVMDFCRDQLEVEIDQAEIDRAHRIGPPKESGPRALIVKFKDYATKSKVMKSKKKLKGKNVFVNEDLTWRNQQFLKHVRQVCKNQGYVFTADGYIFVKRREGESAPVRIRKEADLQRLGFV